MNGDLPDRRKRADEQLERHAKEVEDRLRRFFVKALVAFAILGLTSAGSLFGFGVVLKEQRHTDDNIQSQRFNTIYENCIQQNLRHNRAVKKSKKIFPTSVHKSVESLIDELQPYVEDCKRQALSRVQGHRDVG